MDNSFQSGIVATAGGGQTNAVTPGATTNRITTVATIGDTVKLQQAVGPQEGLCNDDNDAPPTNYSFKGGFREG